MTNQASQGRMRDEAELIERFARSYRSKFSQMIEQLNHQPREMTDAQCLRLCVEAVDMVLASQSQLASALSELCESSASLKKAA